MKMQITIRIIMVGVDHDKEDEKKNNDDDHNFV